MIRLNTLMTLLLLFLSFSLVAQTEQMTTSGQKRRAETEATPAPDSTIEENGPHTVPVAGRGRLLGHTVVSYMKNKNPMLCASMLDALYQIYTEEAEHEGINHDLALAQMMLETGYLSFQGDVNPNQFNFAGIGATGGGYKGAAFPDQRTGIRAQIQHLHAYGTDKPLKLAQVDPRYHLVRRGIAPTLHDLTGKWATDPLYAGSIFRILTELYEMQENFHAKTGK